jgi:hypothetical protein
MMTLRFDPKFYRALKLRVTQLLQETDSAIARRIENAPKGLAIAVPEAAALYEQALTMLVTEVFCNVSMALREVFGQGEGDEKFGPLVAQALAKAVAARQEMDAAQKERSS